MISKPSQQQWNTSLEKFPNAHFLQTSQWASVKAHVGWQNEYKFWEDKNGKTVAIANILKKSLKFKGFTFPFSILYIPRGPILNWEDKQLRTQVLSDLIQYAKNNQAIFIKIDPEIPVAFGMPDTDEETILENGTMILNELAADGWRFAQDQIQFKNTVQIQLTQEPDLILSRMKQKTRYNIRLAERKGVEIRKGTPEDYQNIYRMYAETAIRDGFVIRAKEYYFQVWHSFHEAGYLTPLIASVDNEDVAALILFHFGKTAWYVYGMSREIHRNLMPTYLLQWHAILTAKEKGCTMYDLWGAPDAFNETDPMWGVYRFKQGLGGQTVRTLGAYDFINKPFLYHFYLQFLPKVLNILRKKGVQQTQISLNE